MFIPLCRASLQNRRPHTRAGARAGARSGARRLLLVEAGLRVREAPELQQLLEVQILKTARRISMFVCLFSFFVGVCVCFYCCFLCCCFAVCPFDSCFFLCSCNMLLLFLLLLLVGFVAVWSSYCSSCCCCCFIGKNFRKTLILS